MRLPEFKSCGGSSLTAKSGLNVLAWCPGPPQSAPYFPVASSPAALSSSPMLSPLCCLEKASHVQRLVKIHFLKSFRAWVTLTFCKASPNTEGQNESPLLLGSKLVAYFSRRALPTSFVSVPIAYQVCGP